MFMADLGKVMPGSRVEDEAEESLSDVDINADVVLATEQEEADKKAIWNEESVAGSSVPL